MKIHITAAIVVPACLALCWWQVLRALSGNELSWAYVFEWPLFAGYGVFLWWRLIHEDPDPGTAPIRGPLAPETASSPAALQGVQGTGTPAAPASVRQSGNEPSWAKGASGGAMVSPELAFEPQGAGDAVSCPPTHDGSGRRPSQGDEPDDESGELRAYNEYLAALHEHGRRSRW